MKSTPGGNDGAGGGAQKKRRCVGIFLFVTLIVSAMILVMYDPILQREFVKTHYVQEPHGVKKHTCVLCNSRNGGKPCSCCSQLLPCLILCILVVGAGTANGNGGQTLDGALKAEIRMIQQIRILEAKLR